MRVAACIAVALIAGCSAPQDAASFADALGQPGCHLRHPDGSDAPCTFTERALAPTDVPPPGWVCLYAVEGPGYRYALHRSALTGEHGLQFEDRSFPADASGLLTLDADRTFLARWDGRNPGFVPLGRTLNDQAGATLFIYTLDVVTAEGDASRATVHERWSLHDGFPWLAYDVSFDGQTYTRSGMASGFLTDLDVSNGAGHLATELAWNGGYAFGDGLDGCPP